MTTWKIGDLVRLKSGGPKMTVNAIQGRTGNIIVCTWFVGTDFKEAEFSPDALEKWQDTGSSDQPSGPSPKVGKWS